MSNFFTYSTKLENFFKENGSFIAYKKEAHLVWNNDESDWVFFLVNGFVEINFTLSHGTLRTIGYLLPGGVFAQTGSFTKEYEKTISFTAKTSVTVYRMQNKKFLSLLHKEPEIMADYMKTILKNQIFLLERIVYTGEKDLYHKCIRWLLFMKKFYGEKSGKFHEIKIPLTQESIANFLHATRESVNITLKQLEQEKLIKLSTKKITILNSEKLRKILL